MYFGPAENGVTLVKPDSGVCIQRLAALDGIEADTFLRNFILNNVDINRTNGWFILSELIKFMDVY